MGVELAEILRGKTMKMTKRVVLYLMAFSILSLSWACRQEQEQPKSSVPDNTSTSLIIAAVGDSLTAGLGVEENESYPALLENRLKSEGYDVRVINAGVSGETSSGTLARMDWLLTLKPAIVILETGANDGLRGIDPGLVRSNLEKIIAMLQEKGIIVVFAGMRMAWNLGPGYTSGFNQVYPEIAAEKKLIFMPFFLEGVATNPSLNIDDGLHPNPQGYAVIVNNLLPFVKQALAAVEKGQGVEP